MARKKTPPEYGLSPCKVVSAGLKAEQMKVFGGSITRR